MPPNELRKGCVADLGGTASPLLPPLSLSLSLALSVHVCLSTNVYKVALNANIPQH